MKKILKILKGIIICLLSMILLINMYIVIQTKTKPNAVPNVFGYKPFIVLSGSMEDKIHVGDLIFVKIVDTNSLQADDIIAFRDSDQSVTTHRIINIVDTSDGKCYETKGDASNTKDNDIVCENQIEGKYVSRIAKVGNLILFVQEPLGFTIMMLVIFIICIFIYMSSSKKNTKSISADELKEFEEYKKSKEHMKNH